jgi:hypothetical protein
MTADAELRNVIEKFVAAAARPAVLDPGEEPLPLIPDQWSLSEWNGRLVLEAWDAKRNLVRKLTGLKEQRSGRLALAIERFPRTEGELQIADLAAPSGRDLERKSSRAAFRDRFSLMLAREFPQWRIEEVSAEANLEQSLSAVYTRAFLRLGSSGMAAMAVAPETPDCAGIVPFGLIWLDYLRRREKKLSIRHLLLYVPSHREREAAFRAGWIDPRAADCRLYAFDERDRVGMVDFADTGNVDSVLPPCNRSSPPPDIAIRVLEEIPDAVAIGQSDGSVGLRIRGLEFARMAGGRFTCGVSRRRRASLENVVEMAHAIGIVRNPRAEDHQHPLYTSSPEGWLESEIRAHPETIDASLKSTPIYGQVPIFSGGDRGIVDLLAIDCTGRLAVIEIKASADVQLPFQALDYWLRVRKHLAAGDFERLGYFAGHVVSPEAPRILLVAPALEFHSTTETLLSSFPPEIEVTRIGLAAGWRSELRVMFRPRGNERPDC